MYFWLEQKFFKRAMISNLPAIALYTLEILILSLKFHIGHAVKLWANKKCFYLPTLSHASRQNLTKSIWSLLLIKTF